MYADCIANINPQSGLIASLFMGGLIGSVAHCSGMCGPLVLGQVGALPQKTGLATKALLPYHMGRITTYVMLGIAFSAIVNTVALFSAPKAILSTILLSLAALMFLVSAIPGLLPLFPWLARIGLPVPQGLMSRLVRPLMLNPQGVRGYALGVLLGFMPCGLVIAALMAAAAAPNAGLAALGMLAFGLGTVPMLVTIACGGGWIKRKWPVQVGAFSGIIMLVNALALFWLAARQVI